MHCRSIIFSWNNQFLVSNMRNNIIVIIKLLCKKVDNLSMMNIFGVEL